MILRRQAQSTNNWSTNVRLQAADIFRERLLATNPTDR
jgi:hypothetical protein